MCRIGSQTIARTAIGLLVMLSAGCGLQLKSPDLFVLKRTGPGPPLTLLVNDGGTVRCNGGAAKPLSDPLLLRARDIGVALDNDVKAMLRLAPGRGSVFFYRVSLPDGTISFPDKAAAHHVDIARAEEFALQVAHQVCGLAGA